MNYSHVMDVRLEVRHLKLLAAVAEAGSVTEAGKRLHVTQSALSHQLRDAEERLGTALFLRLGKRMVLTRAGERLLISAKRVLEELKNAEAQIQGMNGDTRGVIRLSTECYTCYHWLPPLLNKFHRKFSKVEVNIDVIASRYPAQALLDGHLDVAIMADPPPNKSLRLTPMFEDEMVLVMAPKHRLLSNGHVYPRDFAGETILIYPPREESTFLCKILRPAGVEPQRIIEVPLTEAIIEMAAAGTGIGLLARWSVAPYADAGKIAIHRLNSKAVRRQWYAVTLRNQPTPEYLDEFLDLLSNSSPKQARVPA